MKLQMVAMAALLGFVFVEGYTASSATDILSKINADIDYRANFSFNFSVTFFNTSSSLDPWSASHSYHFEGKENPNFEIEA